jgi:hypothetical protein
MPFTPSHVAAVLPFRRLEALPFAALAAGSMSPDLPYFLPGLRFLGGWTHTLAGIVGLDVLFGLALWALWRSVTTSLQELAPAVIRERWAPPGWTLAAWWGLPVAVVIGAATHVGWDEFTHAGRFATTHLAFLAASYPSPMGPLAGYRYAQYASGVAGLVVILVAGLRLPRTPQPLRRRTRLALALPWLCLGAAAIGAGVRIVADGGFGVAWDALAFAGITGGATATAGVLLLACWGRAAGPRMVGWGRAGSGAAGQ